MTLDDGDCTRARARAVAARRADGHRRRARTAAAGRPARPNPTLTFEHRRSRAGRTALTHRSASNGRSICSAGRTRADRRARAGRRRSSASPIASACWRRMCACSMASPPRRSREVWSSPRRGRRRPAPVDLAARSRQRPAPRRRSTATCSRSELRRLRGRASARHGSRRGGHGAAQAVAGHVSRKNRCCCARRSRAS